MQGTQLSLIPATVEEGVQQRIRLDRLDQLDVYMQIPLDKTFRDSVKELGVLVPIICTGTDPVTGPLTLVAGRRRVAAALAAGYATIPAILYPTGWASGAVLTLIENAHRSPNLAAELKALDVLEDIGYTHAEIIKLMGWSKATWQQHKQMLGMDARLLDALYAGLIAPTTFAQAAKKLSDSPLRQAQLADLLDTQQRITGEDLYRITRARTAEATAGLPDQMWMQPAFVPPSYRQTILSYTTAIRDALPGEDEADHYEDTAPRQILLHLRAIEKLLAS